MVNQEYVQALVWFASQLQSGETAPPAGQLTLNGKIIQAKALALFLKVDGGQGAVITSVSVPGQSFGLNVPMTFADQFAAYQQALDIITGQVATVTFARYY